VVLRLAARTHTHHTLLYTSMQHENAMSAKKSLPAAKTIGFFLSGCAAFLRTAVMPSFTNKGRFFLLIWHGNFHHSSAHRNTSLPQPSPITFWLVNFIGISVKLSTVGSRVFPVAAGQLWNSLPDDIVLADSLWTSRQLKHYLFQQSYPDVVL